MQSVRIGRAWIVGIAIGWGAIGCGSGNVELPVPFIEEEDDPAQVADRFDAGPVGILPPSALGDAALQEEVAPIPMLPALDGAALPLHDSGPSDGQDTDNGPS